MRIIKTVAGMRRFSRSAHGLGKKIGFVPTMGFFHEGHLSLIRRARKECDIIVVSIFVNPTQFGPQEDLERYPRDLSRDKRLARECGTDIIFAPSVAEMYPEGYSTFVEEEQLSRYLCGRSRPGHFRGVSTVVLKLFNIVMPDIAYFGLKDAQQALIIKRMVSDLNVDVRIRVMPIVREPDGLALSSRNQYLAPDEREAALILHKALTAAKIMIDTGERSGSTMRSGLRKLIAREKHARIDYVEVVDADTLERVERLKGKVMIALAIHIGRTRLIDNIVIRIPRK